MPAPLCRALSAISYSRSETPAGVTCVNTSIHCSATISRVENTPASRHTATRSELRLRHSCACGDQMKLHAERAAVDLRSAYLDQLNQLLLDPRVVYRLAQGRERSSYIRCYLDELRKLIRASVAHSILLCLQFKSVREARTAFVASLARGYDQSLCACNSPTHFGTARE